PDSWRRPLEGAVTRPLSFAYWASHTPAARDGGDPVRRARQRDHRSVSTDLARHKGAASPVGRRAGPRATSASRRELRPAEPHRTDAEHAFPAGRALLRAACPGGG